MIYSENRALMTMMPPSRPIRSYARWVGASLLIALLVMLTGFSTLRSQDLGEIGNAPPVTLKGGVNLRTSLQGSNRDDDDRSPLTGMLSGNLSLSIYGLSLPFSFALSTDDYSFSQPFNQFGLSPQYKWVTAHLGHRNITHSPWTLSGHQIFGAGLEVTPGPIRASFIAGRLRSLVAADSTDSIGSNRTEFSRSGYAGLIGYKGDLFEIELSGLLASDDTTGNDAAILLADGARPAENIVGAVAVAFRPLDGLRLKISAGLSEYTRDVRSDTISLGEGLDALGKLQTPRLSTQVYTGLRAEASFTKGIVGLRGDYTRIDPDFQSMGAYYSASDVEAINLGATLSPAGRKLRLAADLLLSHDNVAGKKRATTSTLGPSLTLDWAPSTAFGLSLNASTRILSQSAGTLPLSDTVRMNYQTPMITLMPRYSIIDTATVHAFSLMGTHQRMIDENDFSASYTEYATTTASLGYSMNRIRSGLSLNTSLMLTSLEKSNGAEQTLGGSLGGSYPVIREALTLNASASTSFSEGARTLGGTAGLSYRGGKNHTISLTLSLTNAERKSTELIDNVSTTDYRGVAGYGYRF